MDVTTRRHRDVLVVGVTGRIDDSSVDVLANVVSAAVRDRDRAVVLVLERLTYIDKHGLRIVPKVFRRLSARTTRLAICAVPERLRRIFEVTGFNKIVATHASLSQALACLAPAQPSRAGEDEATVGLWSGV